MNQVVNEMVAILNGDETYLIHYGMPRRSGRYPWGSGKEPYQHGKDFLSRVEELRKQNATYTDENGKTYSGDTAIAKIIGLSTSQLRTQIGLASGERQLYQYETIKRLKEKENLGWTEIGRKMELSESTVRSMYKNGVTDRMKQARETADFIRKQIEERGMIEVGTGVELTLNISKERMNQALHILEMEGYPIYGGGIPQINNRGQQTNQKVICPPGTEHNAIFDYANVHSLHEYISRDDGKTFEKKFHYPESMDSKRLMVRYAEEGGIEKDGIIELRRGVEDLSLGESRYSQVRILVDGTHYLKGMAVYSDDMPDGVDVIFNTNKKQGTPALGPKDNTVLKNIGKDPDNPFGSAIKDADQGGQYWYGPENNRKLGLINKRADEGDWSDWKDALPSQFLSKQNINMAKKQLNLAKVDKQAEYDEILSINNPTIKKHYLNKFAEECDSAAVHLQAAALPGQKYHVIIPITSMKDTEVYAPNYENGTKVALIRYPHGGTFEIPILTVNNKQATARKLLGPQIEDAVGINSKVAERLSGADFDGDTVMVIPTHDPYGRVKITSTPALKGLEGFDPKLEYPKRDGMRYMKDPDTGKDATQMEMGKISNLITDMTLAGAKPEELAKAVRHSMVVIDAGKHQLDYKRSEIENDIETLRIKYQGKKTGGASTIISKASGEESVIRRQGTPKVNLKGEKWYDPNKPEGALIYKNSEKAYYPDKRYDKETHIMTIKTADGKKISYDVRDKEASDRYAPVKRANGVPIKKGDDITGKEITITDKTGTIFYKVKKSTQASTKMAEKDNAYDLISDARHPMEIVYADYANSMKAMANRARLESLSTGKLKYNKAAKDEYREEVASLDRKLKAALINSPREREAQRRANAELKEKELADPNMKAADKKKIGQQALTKYRQEVGSVKRSERNIEITDREWEAIQKGAISEATLVKILNNADADKLRERATPKSTTVLTPAKSNRIKAMAASNYTLEEIAKKLGVSTSTVSDALKGGK